MLGACVACEKYPGMGFRKGRLWIQSVVCKLLEKPFLVTEDTLPQLVELIASQNAKDEDLHTFLMALSHFMNEFDGKLLFYNCQPWEDWLATGE